MKRFLVSVLIVVLVAGCVGNPAPDTTPTVSRVVIEVVYAAARVGLTIQLQRAGLSPAEAADIVGKLSAVADEAMKGKDVYAIISNPVVWKPIRDDLAKRLGMIIAQAKVSGVPLYDPATAELIAGELIDAFAAAIGRRATHEEPLIQ